MAELSSSPESPSLREERVIRPRARLAWPEFSELWHFRELFWVLAKRSILARYKQTAIGIAWAVLQPVLMSGIFVLVFGYLARLPSKPLLVFAGVLAWKLFETGFSRSSLSVVGDASLITKVYFPRIIIPTSTAMVALVDFALSLLVFLGLMGIFGTLPPWRIALLPAFALLAVALSLGTGLWFAALNVRYRDVKHLIPFLVQIWLYLSPVGYPSSVVPERWRALYACNPVVGIVDGFRWALLPDAPAPSTLSVLLSAVLSLLLLAGGAMYFQRTEASFADEI